MTGPDQLRIDPARSVLLVVDVQERLMAAMPAARRADLVKGTLALIDTARRFGVPVVATAQYPQGLGPLVAEVEAELGQLGGIVHRFDKVEFSVCGAQPFRGIASQLDRDQWWVVGVEAHVCVYQTVRDLCDQGAQVFVAADAVASRTDENRGVGLGLMERCGAALSSSETIIFDVLRQAGGEHFKALSRRIR